jgi:hypothetical protein
MKNRGRPSAASFLVAPVIPAQRPVAPSDLSSEAAEEWNAIVARLPADWFVRETQAMLATLCRAIVEERQVAARLAAITEADLADEDGFKRHKELTHLRLKLADSIGKAMTRMRLTPQSRYSHRTASGKAAAQPRAKQRPWEIGATSAPRRGSENGNNDVYGWGEP